MKIALQLKRCYAAPATFPLQTGENWVGRALPEFEGLEDGHLFINLEGFCEPHHGVSRIHCHMHVSISNSKNSVQIVAEDWKSTNGTFFTAPGVSVGEEEMPPTKMESGTKYQLTLENKLIVGTAVLSFVQLEEPLPVTTATATATVPIATLLSADNGTREPSPPVEPINLLSSEHLPEGQAPVVDVLPMDVEGPAALAAAQLQQGTTSSIALDLANTSSSPTGSRLEQVRRSGAGTPPNCSPPRLASSSQKLTGGKRSLSQMRQEDDEEKTNQPEVQTGHEEVKSLDTVEEERGGGVNEAINEETKEEPEAFKDEDAPPTKKPRLESQPKESDASQTTSLVKLALFVDKEHPPAQATLDALHAVTAPKIQISIVDEEWDMTTLKTNKVLYVAPYRGDAVNDNPPASRALMAIANGVPVCSNQQLLALAELLKTGQHSTATEADLALLLVSGSCGPTIEGGLALSQVTAASRLSTPFLSGKVFSLTAIEKDKRQEVKDVIEGCGGTVAARKAKGVIAMEPRHVMKLWRAIASGVEVKNLSSL